MAPIRRLLPAGAAIAALALPAAAQARKDSSLLSGYGGPGSNEQLILGGTFKLPGGGGSSGGGGGGGSAATGGGSGASGGVAGVSASGGGSGASTLSPTAPGSGSSKAGGGRGHGGTAGHRGSGARGGTGAASIPASANSAHNASSGSGSSSASGDKGVGGLPFTGTELALLLVAGAALIGLGVSMRSLERRRVPAGGSQSRSPFPPAAGPNA